METVIERKSVHSSINIVFLWRLDTAPSIGRTVTVPNTVSVKQYEEGIFGNCGGGGGISHVSLDRPVFTLETATITQWPPCHMKCAHNARIELAQWPLGKGHRDNLMDSKCRSVRFPNCQCPFTIKSPKNNRKKRKKNSTRSSLSTSHVLLVTDGYGGIPLIQTGIYIGKDRDKISDFQQTEYIGNLYRRLLSDEEWIEK